jgi:sialidase-1
MLTIRRLHEGLVIADDAHYYSESSVTQLPTGEILATSPNNRGLAHTDAGSVVLSRSADGGRTWQNTPRQFVFREGPTDGYSSGPITVLADGTVLSHADHTRFLVRIGDLAHIAPRGASQQETAHVARSTDGGHTWSQPWPVRITPMQGCFVRDGILELPDGALLMPLSGARHTISHKFPPNDNDAFRSYLVRSDDRGETWYFYSTVAMDPAGILNLWEPTLTSLPSGRIVALMRSDYVHMIAPPGGELYCCYSDDDGASWSIPHRTPLWGYPADLVTLRDGRVLVTYGHRRDPLSIRIAVSEDGVTWTKENMAVLRELPLRTFRQAGPNFAAFDPHPALATLNVGFRHIGYPDSCVLADGRIVSVYHMWNEHLRQSVECTVYEVE